jgi:sugar-phosphatase
VTIFTASAILFDLDGVLIDSYQCIEYVIQTWAAARGKDPRAVLAVAHGRRTSDTLREVAPELDLAAEVAMLDRMEEHEVRGLYPVPGARELVSALPPDRWAVVTSGSPAVARLRLGVAAIPAPPLLVTSADVRWGKPAPDGYLNAAERLGMQPSECLVIEDAPAGVAAGKAAGMRVIAIHRGGPVGALHAADLIVPALANLRLEVLPQGRLRLSTG